MTNGDGACKPKQALFLMLENKFKKIHFMC